MNTPNHNMAQNVEQKVIGILGGTFDPIHYGHINPVLESANWLGLEQVILLPAHIPPHKEETAVSSGHRAEMVKLVCNEHPRFTLDDRELYRDEPSYTVNTLKSIKAEYPEHVICFFIGMDSMHTFTRWHKHQEILNLCHLLVNTRPGYQNELQNNKTLDLLANHQVTDFELLKQHPAGKVLFCPAANVDISSTLIRQKLRENQSCHELMPPSVIEYIVKHNLYR